MVDVGWAIGLASIATKSTSLVKVLMKGRTMLGQGHISPKHSLSIVGHDER
jgi:hypothetical protein